MQTGKGGERDARGEGGARPSAAEVVLPLRLLALCAARRRDGPRPPPGRARRPVGPGRATLLRSAAKRRSRPDGRQGLTSGPRPPGSRWSPHGGAVRLSRRWAPHRPSQRAAVCGGESRPFPWSPPSLKAAVIPPRPVVCTLPRRRWRQSLGRVGGFPRRQAARCLSRAGWRAAAPEDGKKRRGSGSPAWRRPVAPVSTVPFPAPPGNLGEETRDSWHSSLL